MHFVILKYEVFSLQNNELYYREPMVFCIAWRGRKCLYNDIQPSPHCRGKY